MTFVGREGVEPSQYHYRRILSPLRLPIPPSPRQVIFYYKTFYLINKKQIVKMTICFLAVPTGFEPAISALTGPHVRPLHHGTI